MGRCTNAGKIPPPVIKLLTTKKERMIRMPYEQMSVSRLTRIMFPIIITVVASAIVPDSIGVNVSGQIASVIAGGIILSMFR